MTTALRGGNPKITEAAVTLMRMTPVEYDPDDLAGYRKALRTTYDQLSWPTLSSFLNGTHSGDLWSFNDEDLLFMTLLTYVMRLV